MQPPETSDPIARRDALAGRLLEAPLGLMDLGAVYIGDRPGCCLATGMADSLPAATGTVMRTDTLRRYAAKAAGFRTTEVLSIANDIFRSTGCARRRDGRTRRPAAGAGEAPDVT